MQCVTHAKGSRGKVGLPLQLCMYEQLPLWSSFFESCGFEVVLSDKPSREYCTQFNAACYAAKLMRWHIESLSDNVDFIFLPCESYDTQAQRLTENFNCPVIAYYPEFLRVAADRLTGDNFLTPYIGSRENAAKTLYVALKNYGVKKREIVKALKAGFTALENYRSDVSRRAGQILVRAEEEGRQTVLLAGRPYFMDSEINHGVNVKLTSLGFAVISEDIACGQNDINVFNQWTYIDRLYRAAFFAAKCENLKFVHLVSDGCKIDRFVSEEIRAVLENSGKFYAQIKLGEKDNVKRQIIKNIINKTPN